MIRKDYLMRQLLELIGFMIDLILYQGKNSIIKQDDLLKLAHTASGMKKEDILENNEEDIIGLFEKSETGISQMELMGYVLFEESKKETDTKLRKLLLSRSFVLLDYADQHSNVYSLERKQILNKLSGMSNGESQDA